MATSPGLNLRSLAEAARQKGIGLLAAPDFTHPAWREEMRSELQPFADGVYAAHGALFTLVTEVACIWRHGSKSRRVHLLLMAPSLEAADRVSEALSAYQRLESDGRPMLKLSADRLYETALQADDRCVVVPAHVWTPWYGVYGSKSGFDSLEECFGELAPMVPAIETGLSSDPAMNWGVPDIGARAIVSFSDAHSTGTIGRELTVFDADPDFGSLRSALFENRVVETVEFHPEHGKYHLNGHRKCGVRLTPGETPPDGRCPKCGRPLTLGVSHRVSELSASHVEAVLGADGLMRGPGGRPPFRSLVPLLELLSQALGAGVGSKKVSHAYKGLVNGLGSELAALTEAGEADIANLAGERVAQAVVSIRKGQVQVEPGYDGVYGVVKAV
jgi:uncharacterized protein (TIGR00375 family)